MRRPLIGLLVMTAACLAVLPTSSAFAGRLFATGHDLDLHCRSNQQCGYVNTAVGYVRGGAPDPTKPVLILERLDNDFSVAVTNTFGVGTVPSVSMDPRSATFATAPLNTSTYSAILIASDITCGGCDLNEPASTPDSDAINARTADIAAFFNSGGGLLYGSGASHGDGSAVDDVYYNSAPLPVGGLPVAEPFTLTAEGTALGLTDVDANCCATHNSFVNPPAGSTIIVAERDSAGSSETVFSEGTIMNGDIFRLTLTPSTATNPVGTPHVVTARLSNQNGAVAGRSVLFAVTGVSPTSGSGATSAGGEATFSYTSQTGGENTITACADLDGNAACGPNEPTATAAKRWVGPAQPTITFGPTGIVQTSTVTFVFSSSEPGTTFECRVDNGPFAPCTSPYTTPPLGNGPHTFDVRARDAAGNTSAAVRRSFTVAVTDRDGDGVGDARDNCATTPNANQADKDRDGIGDACDRSDASVGPKLGRTVVARLVSGEVFVRLPARRRPRGARAAQTPSGTPSGFIPLKGAEILPVGTVVHALRGRLALTSAAGVLKGRQRTQRAEFYDGIFQIRQKRARRPVTDIRLRSTGFRKVCGSAARSASAFGARAQSLRATASAAKKRSKRVVSRLWGNGKGRFRTTGRYSAATVRGTIWLTQERCDGTLTRVTRGVVSVRDLRARRTVTVRAGGSYLARAIRATVKTRRP